MRTDDLIRTLAADHASRAEPVPRYLARAIVVAFLLSFVLFASALGPRPDIAGSVGDPRFLFKFVVTLFLAAIAAPLLLRLAQPGAEIRTWLYALAIVPFLLIVGVLVELAFIDPVTWESRLVGRNWLYCLAFIPLLSLPLFVGTMLAVRHGASTRPRLAGAMAGLLAGSIGAALYAAHCVDDSPLFVATWYTVGIALVTAAGAYAGPRILRW